jgi:hypothetical protein
MVDQADPAAAVAVMYLQAIKLLGRQVRAMQVAILR